MEQITISGEKTIIEHISGSVQKSFALAENARFHGLFIVRDADLTLHVHTTGKQSKATITCIFLSKENQLVKAKVTGELGADGSQIELYLLSLLGDKADCQIDGGVTIAPNTSKSSGHLREENIVLGKKVKIKTLPMLDVRSSDVSASHGATIDRLDEGKLFYMMARGLDKKQSQQLIVRGYIERACDSVQMDDDDEKERLIADVMAYIALH